MIAQSIQITLTVVGLLLTFLGSTMIVPIIVDVAYGTGEWWPFALSGGITLFFGMSFFLSQRAELQRVRVRDGFLITTLTWISVAAFGALPLYFSSLKISYTDAFFESMSGFTTTGATVLSGLDTMAPSLLLWRSLVQWFGGVGIIVMAIIVLPFLRVGGMQLFRRESSDISDKSSPRIAEIAVATALVYLGLTSLSTLGLVLSGMGLFDAVNHAMCAIATGGFSTKDASVGYYNSVAIEVVLIVSMTMGALPLLFFARVVMEGPRAVRHEHQAPVFLGILALAIGGSTAWRFLTAEGVPLRTAFRESAFNVTSILTDTGFATTDFSAWGSGAIAIYFLLYFVGGCAGSTAGAIKVFRWQILFKAAHQQFVGAFSPSRVVLTCYAGHNVDGALLNSVRNFFFMYVMTWAGLTGSVMLTGIDFLSAASGVAQAMAGAGPGLGPLVGPATTFAAIPCAAKWLLSLAMLLGRLELTTVYVLFTREFWRD